MSYAGTTKDSIANHPEIQEATGPVTSDSLAAESSSFKSTNNSTPQSVRGANSTFTNTDISGARTLPPTTSGPARSDGEIYQSTASGQDNIKPYDTSKLQKNSETAPSYVNAPKDTSGQEGDFSRGNKNSSIGSGGRGEVGGRNDAARVAVDKIVGQGAQGAGLAGLPKQEGNAGENTYDTLGRDTEA